DGARHQPCTAQGSLKSRFRQPRLHRRGLHALPQRCGARPMITRLFRRVRAKWYAVLAGILLLGAMGAIGAAAVRSPSTVANPAASDSSSVRADDLLHDPNSPVLGNPRGAVTVVEFFDYRCPYCRIMEPRLQELLARDQSVR